MNFFEKILDKNPVILAPMAGITFESYRSFFADFNVGIYYTEMVSDKGIIYGNKETLSYLPSAETPRPLGIQLFGSEAESLCEAIRIIERINDNYDFIDINLGCSVPKVTRSGCGSVLLQNLPRLEEIISAVVKTSKKPVSVKIRLGWNTNEVNNIISTLAKTGVQMIGLHPRYATQLFSGTPHWELIRDIQKSCPIPIVISGDIFTVEDAANAMEVTGAKGVMVARGGMGNPLLAKNIYNYYHKLPLIETSIDSQKQYAKDLISLVCKEKGEFKAIKILRGIIPKFFSNFPSAKAYRTSLATCVLKQQMIDIIDSIQS